MIIGLDDVAFLGNQCNCTLVNNRLFCDTILSGNTVRAGDNFWQEIPGTVDLSAATFGQDLNTTANNQSTHCILVRGGLYVDKYNLASLDRLNSQLSCASRLRQFFPDSGRRID
jgi:hypothetical protein